VRERHQRERRGSACCLGPVISVEDHANVAFENGAGVVDGQSPAEVVLCELVALLSVVHQSWCDDGTPLEGRTFRVSAMPPPPNVWEHACMHANPHRGQTRRCSGEDRFEGRCGSTQAPSRGRRLRRIHARIVYGRMRSSRPPASPDVGGRRVGGSWVCVCVCVCGVGRVGGVLAGRT
jgi:hypothetical protein